jgi:hypothetical protein
VAIAAVHHAAPRPDRVARPLTCMIAAGLVLVGCVAGERPPTSNTPEHARASLNQQMTPSVARSAAIKTAPTTTSAKTSSTSPGPSGYAAQQVGRCDTVGRCDFPKVSAETSPSTSHRAGTEGSSSKVPGIEPNTPTLGVLAVVGSPTNVGSPPSKLSARGVDDALPIVGYVLKHLTDEQRLAIFQSVHRSPSAKIAVVSTNADALIGALVPSSVALDGLRPLPQDVVATLPELRDVMFTSSGDKLLLVNPRLRMVVGVLGP